MWVCWHTNQHERKGYNFNTIHNEDKVMLHAISLAVGTASAMTQIIVAVVAVVLIGIMS
jgi:hypothetical protein